MALLTLVGAALLAPAPAHAQSSEERAVDCLIDSLPLTDPNSTLRDIIANPGGLSPEEQVEELLDLEDELREVEDCIGELLPGLDRDFCDDCDPTFDYEDIRRTIIRFDQGRALRQRLLACRARRGFDTHSDESKRDCDALERVFELYVTDEGSLEARRRDDPRPVDVNEGPPPTPEAVASRALAVSVAPRQSLRGGLRLTCRSPRAGLCRAEVIDSGAVIASTVRGVPAGTTATLNARPTRKGRALLARKGRVRAQVLVRVPGAFTVRTVTLTR